MVGSDPLPETVDAKFSVIDVQVFLSAVTQEAGTIRISVDCEWIFSDSCTPEATFVKLIQAFTVNDKVMGRIAKQMPPHRSHAGDAGFRSHAGKRADRHQLERSRGLCLRQDQRQSIGLPNNSSGRYTVDAMR
jgi:hypothetical protein